MMCDNKMMQSKDMKCTPLSETYTCTDGSKVSADGTITKTDGTVTKLTNGNKVCKDGKIVMIHHGQKCHVCSDACKKKV